MTKEQVKVGICAIIRDYIVGTNISFQQIQGGRDEEDIRLDELPFDSLDWVDICLSIDRIMNVDTEYEKVLAMATLGDLFDYIHGLTDVKV